MSGAVDFVAAIRLAKPQNLAVKRVLREPRQAGRYRFARLVRRRVLRGGVEPFQSQGTQSQEQAPEAGAPLGSIPHRRHHHVDGQELCFPDLDRGLRCVYLICRHDEYNVLIWCGFGYPQKQVDRSDLFAKSGVFYLISGRGKQETTGPRTTTALEGYR